MQAGSAQPNLHSIPRTSSSLPSMAHVACALRWKLNDARREITAAEPLAKASNGCFCAHAAAAPTLREIAPANPVVRPARSDA